MDPTERKITKIAREAGKFTVQAMKEEGIGTAEFDFIHLVRHHPGITQTEVREQLKIDKGAAGCFWSFRKRRQKASAKHWTSCTGNRRENGRIILRNFQKF